jgi:hypothetical protein
MAIIPKPFLELLDYGNNAVMCKRYSSPLMYSITNFMELSSS